ncbi:MAG: o-succinylbenzoate synthase [Bacteroidales bacterium]|nr:o-succinylbenzoate synthase [Bacteroidales bacterium]
MLRLEYKKHVFNFKQPSGTSRGVLKQKTSYHLIVWDSENPEVKGHGECSTIKGLSPDPWDEYESTLQQLKGRTEDLEFYLIQGLHRFPSIRFGLEMALTDLQKGGRRILFDTNFTQGKAGIPINGLIWMGKPEFMHQQIEQKINQGYPCIKMKIGALSFEQEMELLQGIRDRFGAKELELRVDANGAFAPEEALEKLKRLSGLDIHSIEQPIRQGQWDKMAGLCKETPVPIALDEELIGRSSEDAISQLLDYIQPQYVILKPSLLGGFEISENLIREAEKRNIGWWVTSALEGNIGLNAIAQWTATFNPKNTQGLGTGSLFTNNIPSPLYIADARLHFDPKNLWNLNSIHE